MSRIDDPHKCMSKTFLANSRSKAMQAALNFQFKKTQHMLDKGIFAGQYITLINELAKMERIHGKTQYREGFSAVSTEELRRMLSDEKHLADQPGSDWLEGSSELVCATPV